MYFLCVFGKNNVHIIGIVYIGTSHTSIETWQITECNGSICIPVSSYVPIQYVTVVIPLYNCICKGLKELSPTLNLRKLYETETLSSEPILVIISPGVDPSQVSIYNNSLCIHIHVVVNISITNMHTYIHACVYKQSLSCAIFNMLGDTRTSWSDCGK